MNQQNFATGVARTVIFMFAACACRVVGTEMFQYTRETKPGAEQKDPEGQKCHENLFHTVHNVQSTRLCVNVSALTTVSGFISAICPGILAVVIGSKPE